MPPLQENQIGRNICPISDQNQPLFILQQTPNHKKKSVDQILPYLEPISYTVKSRAVDRSTI